MWKNLTRTLRETIEKRTNLTSTRDKKKSQSHPSHDCYTYILQKNLGSLCSITKSHNNQKNVFEPTNCPKKRFYYQHANQQHDKGKQQHKSQSTTFNYGILNTEKSIFGALRGSSILILIWYLSQPIYWTRLCTNSSDSNKSTIAQRKYIPLTTLLSRIAYAQPNVASIKPISNDSELVNDITTKRQQPLRSEEIINVAVNNFRHVHLSTLSTIENSFGIKCMENDKKIEGKLHFERAIQLHSIPALFNLGLYYEQQENLQQAVYYYKLASEKGHPAAKYNLGVLHANGLGGLKQDKKTATNLFKEAAALGQQEALDVLKQIEPKSHAALIAEKANKMLQKLGIRENVTRTTKSNNSDSENSLNLTHKLVRTLINK